MLHKNNGWIRCNGFLDNKMLPIYINIKRGSGTGRAGREIGKFTLLYVYISQT